MLFALIYSLLDMSKYIRLGGFRMEKLDWRSSNSLAKSLGTIVSISGAFIVTFYKGPTLLMTSSSSDWVIGGLLLVADCIMTSAWLIVEVEPVK